jgi:hypothetical protein
MIRNGNKLYELNVRGDKKKMITPTVFRDSYNLAPFALGKFVKAFGLSVEEKRHFPHFYNKEENYGITLPHLPPLVDYSPDTKKPDDAAGVVGVDQPKSSSFKYEKSVGIFCSLPCP